MRMSVRWFLFWLVSMTGLGLPIAHADENVAQEFSGSGSTTTAIFKVQGKWEVRWNARQVVSVAVMAPDGTIVAGAAGVLRGSLFIPVEGQYYLKISDATVVPPPAPATNPLAAGTNAPPTSAVPPGSTNSPPLPSPSPTPSPTPEPSTEATISWHLQVVELGASVPANAALTVYTPFFIVPDVAVAPGTPPPVAPPPTLTDRQMRALVTIRGDNATGTGFLLHSPDGNFVVTTLHLLAANPNIKISTVAGVQVNTTSLKAAADRDVAFFTVADHPGTIPLATDPNSIKAGDQVIIPDVNQRYDALAGRSGTVIGIGPQQIDFDTRLGSNAEGSPVINVKNGNVLAMVGGMKKVDISNTIAQAWPANPAPGSAGIIPYYGLRLTGIKAWENYDPDRFLSETLFLKQVHTDTRYLDSYLNGRHHHSIEEAETAPHSGNYYLNNPKLRSAIETYNHFSVGADKNQRLQAARELLFDLIGIADTDVATLQDWNSPYTYDRTRAQEELAYRKALRKQLDDLSNNIVQFDDLARTR